MTQSVQSRERCTTLNACCSGVNMRRAGTRGTPWCQYPPALESASQYQKVITASERVAVRIAQTGVVAKQPTAHCAHFTVLHTTARQKTPRGTNTARSSSWHSAAYATMLPKLVPRGRPLTATTLHREISQDRSTQHTNIPHVLKRTVQVGSKRTLGWTAGCAQLAHPLGRSGAGGSRMVERRSGSETASRSTSHT